MDHLGVGLLHIGHPLDDLDLLLAGQTDEDFRGLVIRQVAENQGNRLRMLVLNERQQVVAFGFLKERERRALDLMGNLLNDLVGHLAVQTVAQQILGVFQPAFGHPRLGQGELIVFLDHGVAHVLVDRAH